MIHRFSLACLALLVTCLLAGCGSEQAKRDVIRYLGKSEAEIKDVFGAPSAWCGPAAGETASAADSVPRRLMYRKPAVTLPQPYTGLDFVIAQDGRCNEVAAFTDGFKTPGELLQAAGLDEHVGGRVDENDKAIRFRSDTARYVDVLKPLRIPDCYSDLVIEG